MKTFTHHHLRSRAQEIETSVQKLQALFETLAMGIYEEWFEDGDHQQGEALFFVRRGEGTCKQLTEAVKELCEMADEWKKEPPQAQRKEA